MACDQVVVNPEGDVVGIVVVVAKEGSAVDDGLAQNLFSLQNSSPPPSISGPC
jgi:hypothetical protein